MASVTKNDRGNEPMADEKSSLPDDRAPEKVGKGAAEEPRAHVVNYEARQGGFFTIYKRGQGYWTRMGTALAAALISLLTAHFVYGRMIALKALYGWKIGTVTMIAVSAAVFAALMLWAWRLMNRPGNVDFLVATDSEMKKVNWTTRKELIGSTKVVCFFVILIAAILFALDLIFGYLFYAIRVLEVPPI
jgi:preprotein translocase SecE subunit